MRFISYIKAGKLAFGILSERGIVDLSSRLGGIDLGEALRRHGAEGLLELGVRHTPDLALEGRDGIDGYRAAVPDPQQIFCIGLNYEEHRVEARRERTSNPTVFLRLAASQTGHNQPLLMPPESAAFDYEGEIAIVIGRGGRRIAAEKAFSHIFGFACYNDGSIRDWQAHTTQWAPGKNFPATGAFGPSIASTQLIGENDVLSLTTRLNGETVQHATTDMMIFSIPELIAYLSTFTPLFPGDVIVTGTPGGVGFKRQPPLFMKPGDSVEVEVSQVGVLANTVAAEEP